MRMPDCCSPDIVDVYCSEESCVRALPGGDERGRTNAFDPEVIIACEQYQDVFKEYRDDYV